MVGQSELKHHIALIFNAYNEKLMRLKQKPKPNIKNEQQRHSENEPLFVRLFFFDFVVSTVGNNM